MKAIFDRNRYINDDKKFDIYKANNEKNIIKQNIESIEKEIEKINNSFGNFTEIDPTLNKMQSLYECIFNELNTAKYLFEKVNDDKKKIKLKNHINNLQRNLDKYLKEIDDYRKQNKEKFNFSDKQKLNNLYLTLLKQIDVLKKLEEKINGYIDLIYIPIITKIKIDDILCPKLGFNE